MIEEFQTIDSFIKTKRLDVPVDFVCATSIGVFWDGVSFLISKKKYWVKRKNKMEIYYTGIGGKFESYDKSILGCLRREIKEEIGSGINFKIASSKKTYILPNKKIIKIKKGPSPFFISTATFIDGENISKILVICYLLQFNQGINQKLSKPLEDIPGFVLIHGDFLKKFLKGKISIKNNQYVKDIIFSGLKEKLPQNFILKPKITPTEFILGDFTFEDVLKCL